MTDTRTPDALCPVCGYHMDHAASVGTKAKPTPGDFSLCLDCGAFLRFDKTLQLVLATDAELESDLNPKSFATAKRAQNLIRKRGRLPPRGMRN